MVVIIILDLLFGIFITAGCIKLPFLLASLNIIVFLLVICISIGAIIDRLMLFTKIEAITKYHSFDIDLEENVKLIDKANIIWFNLDNKKALIIFDAEHFICEGYYIDINELWFDPADSDVLSIRKLKE